MLLTLDHCKKERFTHLRATLYLQTAAIVSSGLLLMAVMGILFPAVLHFTHTEVHFGKSELALSRFSSCVMLVAYASYLFFQLKSHANLYDSVDEVGLLFLKAVTFDITICIKRCNTPGYVPSLISSGFTKVANIARR